MRTLNTALASLTLAVLTACGGGGGSSAPAAPVSPVTPSQPVVVVSDAGTLQTSAPVATYGASSNESSAFAAVNAARLAAGAGVVVQSSQMDVAAAAHARYLTTNISGGLVHFENAAQADFYAASPAQRIALAGFNAGTSTEVIGGTGASAYGGDCIMGLLNTVYHAAALLSSMTHVGIGFGTDAAGIPMCVANLATASGASNAQVAPAGSVVAYPYAGQANVLDTFYVAYESPRPSATLFPNLTAGTPVVVNLRNADFVNAEASGTLDVVVSQFRLQDANGNLVPVGILANPSISGAGVTMTADGNLGAGFVVLVPLSPLAKGVTYTASFAASVAAGKTVSKTWSFTTGL